MVSVAGNHTTSTSTVSCVRTGRPPNCALNRRNEQRQMRPRESTHIYQRRVDRVIDYIKDHLTEPLSIAELARLAHFSPFHFHRIFRSMVGETLHAFVRRMRLQHAVYRMQYGPKAKLTAIALEAG